MTKCPLGQSERGEPKRGNDVERREGQRRGGGGWEGRRDGSKMRARPRGSVPLLEWDYLIIDEGEIDA